MANSVSRRVFALAATALIAALAGALVAGPLDPPAGPVSSSYKTLSEVEPRIAINAANTPGDADSLFKITQPGSYYLTGNITGVAGKHGIEIAASGVTLDLNGFDLVGIPGMGAFDGVNITIPSLKSIAVVNGSARNWGRHGVNLGGVFIATDGRITGVQASGNAGAGIRTCDGCTVTNCSAHSNGGGGMYIANGCTISHCSAHSNTGIGLTILEGCTAQHCTAHSNTGDGISLASGGTASNCSAFQNTGAGITTGNGIGCTFLGCSSDSNGTGFSIGAASTVADCTALFNTLDGILCSANCTIRGNTCSFNGNNGNGAGIHATDADNRIEGNNCTGADRGIGVDAGGNIIIRNTCKGNTINWVIAANNVCGPILDRTIPSSAAISGNSAPSSLGSTEPNANFTY